MKKNFLVILYLAALFAIISFPLVPHLNTEILATNFDPFPHIWRAQQMNNDFWAFNWLKPSNMVFYPFGSSISSLYYPFDFFTPLLLFLLGKILPITLAYNILTAAAFIATGFSLYLLTLYVARSVPAAMLAATFFVFSRSYMNEIQEGILEQVHLYLVIFFILYLVRFAQERNVKDVYRALVFLVLSAFNTLYFLQFDILFAFAIYLYYDTNARRKAGVIIASVLAFAALCVAGPKGEGRTIASLMLLPRDYIVNEILSQPMEAYQSYETMVVSRLFTNVTDLHSFIARTPTQPFAFFMSFVFVLSLAGLITNYKESKFWIWSGLFFFFLSLGPYLVYNGQLCFPLPTLYFLYCAPFLVFERMGRLFTLFNLCFSVGAGIFLKSFFGDSRLNYRKNAFIFGLMLLLSFVELYWISPVFSKVLIRTEIPPFYRALANESDSFAVMHWPLLPPSFPIGKYYFYQSAHKKAITNSFFVYPKNLCIFLDWMKRNTFVRAMAENSASTRYAVRAQDVEELIQKKIKYFILTDKFEYVHHLSFFYMSSQRALYDQRVYDFLDTYFGPPVFSDTDTVAFNLYNFKGKYGDTLSYPLPEKKYTLLLSSYKTFFSPGIYEQTTTIAEAAASSEYPFGTLSFWVTMVANPGDPPCRAQVTCGVGKESVVIADVPINTEKGFWERIQIPLKAVNENRGIYKICFTRLYGQSPSVVEVMNMELSN